MSATPGIIVALDGLDPDEARELASLLSPAHCRLKVGSELFLRGGPATVQTLRDLGHDIFLDLKFHDIPNTVAQAVRAARALDVQMCTVHAAGGPAMLEAARDAADDALMLLAVTVLTALDDRDLEAVGQPAAGIQVARLAELAVRCGIGGVVCSAREAAGLRARLDPVPCLVTPGIRATGDAGDQKRTATPREAARAGADWLVIGRPIVQAEDPPEALARIRADLGQTTP